MTLFQVRTARSWLSFFSALALHAARHACAHGNTSADLAASKHVPCVALFMRSTQTSPSPHTPLTLYLRIARRAVLHAVLLLRILAYIPK